MTPIPPTRLSLLAGVCLTSFIALSGAAPLRADDTGADDLTAPTPLDDGVANAATTAANLADQTQTEDQRTDPTARQDDDTKFGTDTGGGEGTNVTGIDGGQIIVERTRLRGQLDVEQAPLLELGEEDIAAEGVASIADLVTQIQNQTGSARGRGGGGRPIILVNGIRTGSFRELFQYPPEALAKVEVFPEEVATRFGFPPDRRVINLILKPDYSSREIEVENEGPTRGGYLQQELELGLLKIADGGRINFNFTASDISLLTEDERDIIQTPGSVSELASDPNTAEFRSLVPDSRSIDTNLSWAKAFLSSGISVSANANYERRDSRSLDGLNIVTLTDASGESLTRTFGEADPLERRTATDNANASGSFSAPLGAFRVTSTFDAGLSETTTEIDNRFDTAAFEAAALAGTQALDGDLPTSADAGFETAFLRTTTATHLNTFRGPLANLPGGELLATFDLGYNWNRTESSDTRTFEDVQLTRGNITTGANFVIPITSRRNGFADKFGSLTLNAQVGLEELSDFGTLGDYNASLNWKPVDGLDLSATYIFREVAPGLTNLGNPQITNFNVPVFDFVNGETVLADVTNGGNPDLQAQTQRDWKFALNWELPFIDGTRFTVEYIRNRSDDVTSGFPQITQAIEAAFPDRVTRDAFGTLVAVDRRPVNFAQTRADRLQFRLSTRGGFGGARLGGGRGGPPPGVRGGRPGGRPSGARPTGAGGAPGTSAPTASAPAGAPGAGGQPAQGRRGAFMALREKLCADDGLDFLKRLVTAAQNGEDVAQIAPGLPPRIVERMLARLGGGEGEVSDERLAMARTRICSMDPSAMAARGGRAGGRAGPPGGAGLQAGLPGRPNAEQMEAMRARLCGADGLAVMRRLVAMIERGEDVSAILPGMDPAFLKFGLDRLRGEDGTIPDEGLERIRSRICASDAAGGPASGGASPAGGGQAGGRPSGRPGGGGPAFNPLAGGRGGGWRYFANLTHTIELQNEILIAPGVAVLDQLDGDATGAFGFPRHTSRLEAGVFGKGIGFRLSGRYTGETRLNGSGLAGSSDLFFGDLVTFNLRSFINIDQITGSKSPALKNVRVSLRMDNVFDGQRAVRDENGDTPINYQPFVIDPVGRFIGIDVRKLF